jgi:hypothetical protein
MDPSFNDFENLEVEIRVPDEVKRERLIPDTRSEFDIEMDEVLYLSMQELRHQNIENDKFEEEIMNNYRSETIERREKFRDLLINMNKLCKFDKDIKELHEFLSPIIDSYCDQHILNYEVDEKTYDKVFKFLGTIRINKNTLKTLKTIIIKSS